MYDFILELGGTTLPVSFAHPETAGYFGSFCRAADGERGPFTALTEWDWVFGARVGVENTAAAEYSLFSGAVSAALSYEKRCLIHAAAVRFRDRAWLIAAAPGVGKSTQARTLMELWPGEFGVICGDRPLLEFRGAETWVHPTPWNGKEGWHGAEAAPLGGIVLLRRGEEDALYSLSSAEAALPVFCSLIHTGADEKTILALADCARALLESAPVLQLVNAGVPHSTRLLYENVFTGGTT